MIILPTEISFFCFLFFVSFLTNKGYELYYLNGGCKFGQNFELNSSAGVITKTHLGFPTFIFSGVKKKIQKRWGGNAPMYVSVFV